MSKFIRTIALILCTLMLTFTLIGCADTSNPSNVPEIEPENPVVEVEEIALIETDKCAIYVKGVSYDEIWGATVELRVENYTDKTMFFTVDNVSANGFMMNPLFAETVSANKKSNTGITFFLSDLEANEITKIETISFELTIYDNWDSNNFLSSSKYIDAEPFTIDF